MKAHAVDVLNQVGIPDPAARVRAYPHRFSGGMRQRVAIAADKSTTALDVSIQVQILHQMRELARDTRSALIWISHDLATVSSIASSLLVMYAGKIVEEGPTATVLRAPRHPTLRG